MRVVAMAFPTLFELIPENNASVVNIYHPVNVPTNALTVVII